MRAAIDLGTQLVLAEIILLITSYLGSTAIFDWLTTALKISVETGLFFFLTFYYCYNHQLATLISYFIIRSLYIASQLAVPDY